jgi:conjugative transposon TraJ protein
MKRYFLLAATAAGCMLSPFLVQAQVDPGGTANSGVNALHSVLNTAYDNMMPLCGQMINIAQAIAGLGVLFYIAVRVWKHIARAEAIDFFPLLRPFAMILLISIFPYVVAFINYILSPTVTYTAALVTNSNAAVSNLLSAEAAQVVTSNAGVLMTPNPQGSQQGWDQYSQPGSTSSDGGGFWSAIGNGFKFLASGIQDSFRFIFKFLLSIILEVLYYAASLCIDTIRVFQLIVLAILGPFAFAFACYDGFQSSLTHWLQRYINIYLWLPVANILGAILGQIQQNMIQNDLNAMQSGSVSMFSVTDFAYLIFLLIGIIGYCTVPGLANYIVHTHGPNPLTQAVNKAATMAVQAGAAAATGGASAAAGGAGAAAGGGAGASASGSGMGAMASQPNQYNHDKIAGS